MATDLAATLPSPLRDLRTLKNVPIFRQLLMLAGLALAIAIGIALFTWSQKPNLAPLYANLGDKDSSEVADALRVAGIEYHLDAASGAVLVPADKVHESRLRLASQGLPKGSALGMEMIQGEQGFGTSQFIETARYQLALETELARTVGSLTPVKGARVHLALPKPSAFMRAKDGASASVLVELHPGRQLEPSQVASIVHMVASSVPNLATSAVTVVDQYGHLLTQNAADSDTQENTEQFDYARKVEADYVRRIEQLLTPMMGAGRISAQVAADLDFSVTEEAREAFNPNPQAIRSEQTSEDNSRTGAAGSAGAGGLAQGVPGATSNQPPSAALAQPLNPPAAVAAAGAVAAAAKPPAAGSSEPASQSRTATRNFELDKTVSHTRQAAGRVRRLSIAVLVDHLPKADAQGKTVPTALTPEELARVETLVKEAVGFDAKRGDSVAVQNAAFISPDAAAPPPALPLWQQPEARDYARQGLGAGVLLVLGLFVLRPTLRNLLASSTPKTVEGVIEAMNAHDAAAALRSERRGDGTASSYDQQLSAARAAVAQDPKRVAQVVKNWMEA